MYVKHEIYLLRLNLLWDPCENAPAFFLIVCTLHVLCADDVLMLTFTVLVCTPGWRGPSHTAQAGPETLPCLAQGTLPLGWSLLHATALNCNAIQKGWGGKQQIQLVSAKPSFQLHPQSSLLDFPGQLFRLFDELLEEGL